MSLSSGNTETNHRKEIIRGWLNRIANMAPWVPRLCLWCLWPFPSWYFFCTRAFGVRPLVRERVWHLSDGPLKGALLTGVLQEEIIPVLANSMESNCTNLLERLPLHSQVTCDIGGSYGYYSLLLSRLVGEGGHVFSFEPDWHSFQRLASNLALNHLRNVTPIPLCLSNVNLGLALWESFGEQPYRSRLDGIHTSIINDSNKPPWEKLVVPVTTLDAFVDTMTLSRRIGLVKLDVEGAELKVLEGARGVFSSIRPLLLCELHGDEIALGVFSFLSDLNYQWHMVDYVSENRQHIFAFPSEQEKTYQACVAA